MISAKLDVSQVTQQYGAALRRLSELTGFDQKTVLLGEAGAILKTWAGRTKVATDAQADRRTWLHILGPRGLDVTGSAPSVPGAITVNAGVRGQFGRVWVKSKEPRHRDAKGKPWRLAGVISPGGQSFRPMNYHWRNPIWTDIQETAEDVAIQSRKKIPKGRRAAGLARQSVVQIADSLGIDLATIPGGGINAAGLAKARSALATSGRAYKNGTGTALDNKEKSVVTLINRLPYGTASKMDQVLLGVMAGRVKFFQQSYAKGAFDTVARTARAYPWMRVNFNLAA